MTVPTPPLTISGLVSRNARYRGEHLALIADGRRLTYDDFNKRINRLANGLSKLGLVKGDKIASVVPNCLELMLLYWAAAKTGLVVVPMSPLLAGPGLRKLIADSDSVAVLAHVSTAETVLAAVDGQTGIDKRRRILAGGLRDDFTPFGLLSELGGAEEPADAQIASSDLFNIIYSSGTTGEPKGIMHSHYVRAMYASLFASALRMTPESVTLHAGAIIFNGAFVTLMPTFFCGATYVMLPAFDADSFIDAIEAEGASHVMLVPTQIAALLNHPRFTVENVGSLQCVLSLGAPLPLEHKLALERLLPGRFHELYGVTEGFVVILDRTDFARKPNSVGIPTPFFEVRVIGEDGCDRPAGQIGEIVGRGPILMPGYYKRPDLTAAAVIDGWLRSGDLGYLDEDGYLFLVDRKKDMIISGGVNVYPRDIEEVAARHADVQEVAVFGARDPQWGETPIAAVLLKPGAETSPGELKDWINSRVDARYQKVSLVAILDAFPRNAAGKILKRELRTAYEAAVQVMLDEADDMARTLSDGDGSSPQASHGDGAAAVKPGPADARRIARQMMSPGLAPAVSNAGSADRASPGSPGSVDAATADARSTGNAARHSAGKDGGRSARSGQTKAKGRRMLPGVFTPGKFDKT